MSSTSGDGTAIGRTIEKTNLSTLLSAVAKQAKVYLPKRNGASVEFEVFETEDTFTAVSGPSRLSPKSFFFPQTETLYTFDFDTIESESLETAAAGGVLLMGSMMCTEIYGRSGRLSSDRKFCRFFGVFSLLFDVKG